MRGKLAVSILLVCIIATDGGSIAGADTQDEHGVPRLYLPKPTHDFGKVRSGETVRCSIPVQNVGTDVLKITNVKAGCSCSVAKLKKSELMPGDETMLDVSYKAGSYASTIKRTIRFETNDPKAKTATITLLGEVVPRVIVSPRNIRFRDVSLGEERHADLVVRPGFDETEWYSVRVTTTSPSVSVEPAPLTHDDVLENRWPYRVTLKEDAPAGRVYSVLHVYINEETKPAARVTLWAQVQGRIRVTPPSASIYTKPDTSTGMARVVLSHQANEPFDITDVKCDVPQVEWELDEMKGQARYELRLRLKDSAPVGKMLRGNLTLAVTDELQHEVRIPVFAQRRPERKRTRPPASRVQPASGSQQSPQTSPKVLTPPQRLRQRVVSTPSQQRAQ